ncbi:MAG: hypothetical protein LH473_02630, partial [Chitinophagales bacterium]|nr:hypothetical protein [Chitinophagales bacterium]
MLEFARSIERTVSINRLEQAVEEFQNALSKFNPSNLAGTAEQKELRNLLATTSQRLYQTKEMEMRGGTASDVIQRERTAISNQILDLIYGLDRYPEVSRFL